MGYRKNQFNMPLIKVKKQEIEAFMKLTNGIDIFIDATKKDIDKFPIDGNFNELFDKLIVLLYATTNIISEKSDNKDDANIEKLIRFHNDYIHPRYSAMKDVISTARLKYFAFYGEEAETLREAILDWEV